MKLPEFELIQPHSLERPAPSLESMMGRPPSWGGTALVVAFRYRLSKPAVYPGSRKPRPLAVDECANFWPGCRPDWA